VSISSALEALGGEREFIRSLKSEYDLVVSNLVGTLAEWGCNCEDTETIDKWRYSNELATGAHFYVAKIKDRKVFANKLNTSNYISYTPDKNDNIMRDVTLRKGTQHLWGAQNIGGTQVIVEFNSAEYVRKDVRDPRVSLKAYYGLGKFKLSFIGKGSVRFSELASQENWPKADIEGFRRIWILLD